MLYHHAETAAKEAEWIADRIGELSAKGVPLKDITVLYRAHYVTRPIEEFFQKKKLPYRIYSGVQFFDRAEIKDALSYLRMIILRDDLSFRRIVNVPKRNIGQRRVKILDEYSAGNGCSLWDALRDLSETEDFKGTGAQSFIRLIERLSEGSSDRSVSELLSAALDESGYEKMLRTEGSQERLDNLAELKQSAYEYETSCGEEASAEDYLAHVAMFTNSDTADPGDKVRLMTVHAAKGLEFPYVFLCGLNEGVFPSRKVNALPQMEEERRLAYVAITRAKEKLYITYCSSRMRYGYTNQKTPSRFLSEIPAADKRMPLQKKSTFDSGFDRPSTERVRPEPAIPRYQSPQTGQRTDFAPGDRVLHPFFGPGEVLTAQPMGGDILYEIRFDSGSDKRLMGSFAKLRPASD